MMRPAILFDLDGTLIDSAPDIHAAVNLTLQAAGLPDLTFAQVRSFIGRGVPHLIARVLAASGHPDDPDRQAATEAAFLGRYEDAVGLTGTYPHVIAILDELMDSGYRLGICTNKPLGPTRAVLAHLGLLDRFAVIIGGDSLPQRKPDAAPLLRCLADLGGGLAIFVGDSEVDCQTAAAARMPFVLFTEGYRTLPPDALPHTAKFGDFNDLPGILANLTQHRSDDSPFAERPPLKHPVHRKV